MQQNTALPPGWEAKWDPQQNRHFYIDHSTKKTSWVDPRTTQGSGDSAAAALTPSATARHSPQVSGRPVNIPLSDMSRQTQRPAWQKQETSMTGSKQKIEALKTLYPTAPDWKITNTLTRLGNDLSAAAAELKTSGYQEQDADSQRRESSIVSRLNQEFASADVGVVRDVVQCFDNNEERARTELKALGYESRKQSRTSTSTARAKSPAKKATPARAESPAKVSEQEKARMTAQLVREFPEYSETMIGIAMESAKFKIDHARTIIKSMLDVRNKKTTQKRESSPSKTSASRSRAMSPTFGATTSSYAGGSSTPALVTYPAYDSSFTPSPLGKPKKTAVKITSSTPETSVASRLSKSRGASNVATRKQTTRGAQNAMTSAPCYVSANKTAAVGANADLSKGPDDTLLIEYLESCVGPNRDICHGPDSSNHHGSSGAVGPDSSLQFGANGAYRCGVDLNQQHTTSPQRMLVTST